MRTSKSAKKRPPRTNPLVSAFASRLSTWRKQKGLALKEVAGDLGVSMAIVCEWEHGQRFPSVDHLQSLAQYTGMPASSLIAIGLALPPAAGEAVDGPSRPSMTGRPRGRRPGDRAG